MPKDKTEADWQAESDAHTLVMAEEIKADKQRLEAATKKVPEIREEAQARLTSVNRLASGLRKSSLTTE